MRNFGRVLRIAAGKRWSLAGIFFSSLLIALLWGANIGTLYPLVEVVFKGDSVPQYAANKIEESNAALAEVDQELKQLRGQLGMAQGDVADRDDVAKQGDALGQAIDQRKVELAIETAEARRRVISDSVYYLKKFQPTIDRWAPESPYSTLMLIVAILTGGTALEAGGAERST